MISKEQLKEFIHKETINAVLVNSSIDNWAKNLGINLRENQLEIMENILNPSIRDIVILASRSGGKTFTVSVAVVKQCVENRGYRVILVGPKADLSARIIKDGIVPICKGNSVLSAEVDWDRTTQKEVVFKNGSWVRSLGGTENTQVEGYHCDMIVVDEAHQLSDYFYKNRISPMNQDSDRKKNIKIGITLYDNHLRDSATRLPGWKVLCYPWYKCPYLFKKNDLITIDGKPYPKSIVDVMPLSMKIKRWPNNPEVHYESTNGMLEEEFKTQYEMEWVDTIGGFLTGEDQELLQGEHDYLYGPLPSEKYYFGLDFAGGSQIQTGPDRDSTQLVIGRLTPDHKKEVVALFSWQGDTTVQAEEIIHIITKVFPCEFGCADYSTMGTAIVDQFLQANIPICGISYKKTEPTSGKNYKNSIFDQFIYELRHNRFKYPSLKSLLINNRIETVEAKLLNEHLIEWCSLQRTRRPNGINDEICAPKESRVHDDCPNASALFVWACDKCDAEKSELGLYKNNFKMSLPIFGTTTTQNRQSALASQTTGFFGNKVFGNGGIKWGR